jgi:3-methyladenine DNA glycosylase AlkC
MELMSMADALKDMYNPAFFADLTAALTAVSPVFDAETFRARIYDDAWEARPLKNRVRHIAMTLHGLLPDDYRSALEVLLAAAPHLSQYGFQLMFLPDFVELYGLDDWDASLPALETFTQLCSSEFAVRPFILQDSGRMMDQMLRWTGHENHHVRRLASEGCRPRLPWAMALPPFKRDPMPVLAVLERLKNDSSEYVRRSVANNLNDIAKDNPDAVIATLRRWQIEPGEGTAWITRHSLRTLIKSGHMEALDLLGYQAGSGLTVRAFQLGSDTIQVGDSLSFAFEIESAADAAQDLMIDYIVYFVKANGKRAPKVFKLAQRKINPGETLCIEKRHSFKPITTRVYYPGEHALALKINGQEFEGGLFTLSQSS